MATITVEVSEATTAYLQLLTTAHAEGAYQDLAAVLGYLAASVADGMRRPGAWERQVVQQLFGDGFEQHLITDPQAHWQLIPKPAEGNPLRR